MTQSIGISQVDGNLEIVARNASPELTAELVALSDSTRQGAVRTTYVVADSYLARHYISRIGRVFGMAQTY
jgi:hypothetical protein